MTLCAEQKLKALKYRDELEAKLDAEWFPRLMEVMKEANSISITENNEFRIEIWIDDEHIQADFPYELTADEDKRFSLNWALERFEDEIQMRNRRMQEELKKQLIKSQALAKLTKEEKEALGL